MRFALALQLAGVAVLVVAAFVVAVLAGLVALGGALLVIGDRVERALAPRPGPGRR